jgi:hypothetical protein
MRYNIEFVRRKTMKKKFIHGLSILLVCLMLLMSAVGCGSSDKKDNSKDEDISDEEDEDEDEDSSDETEDEDTDEENESEDDSSSDVLSIEDGVLLDQDGIVITSNGLVDDGLWGMGIALQIENNSGKDVSVSSNAVIVNGFMITDYFFVDISSDKTANETLYLSTDELAEVGLNNIGEIEIYFNVSEQETYETILDSDCITIQTSQYDNMGTTSMDGGYILVDQDGVLIIGKFLDENSYWGNCVQLYIENNTGKNISVGCDSMSINGFMVDPYFSSVVYDGKKAIAPMYIYDTDLEANGITSIDEIEVSYVVYDDASYDTLFESELVYFAAN